MFRNAFTTVGGFIRPVIISWKTVSGECDCSTGAYIVVNNEGWILTAYHIVLEWDKLNAECTATGQLLAARAAVENDQTLSHKVKHRQLGQLPKPHPKAKEKCSLYWGDPRFNITQVDGIEGVDISTGKIEPFDPAWVTNYPAFKDPTQGVQPGVSLARLGYPFQQMKPTYDAVNNRFDLGLGNTSPPVFMNEGIISRMIAFQVPPGQPQQPFLLGWIETSSPGLKGQSGGPIFDVHGTVWAIQSNTGSYALDFEPPVPNRPAQKEYQFLNVGRGVHPETIVGFLRQQNVNFTLANN